MFEDMGLKDTSMDDIRNMGEPELSPECMGELWGDYSVMLIGAKMNYLLNSIKDRLNETELSVQMSDTDIDSMQFKEDVRAVIIYADGELVQNQKLLVYVKDRVLERELPVFLVGTGEELEVLRENFPKYLIVEEYERPVNVREMVEHIEDYVLQLGNAGKKKVLVVDDSSIMLHNLKGWMGEKYKIALADSGIAAIKSIIKSRPDLILMESELPIVDGKQVMQMLRSDIEFADIPIIFLTGKGDRETVLEVMALKPDGYLLKSMRPDEIIQAIDDFFVKQKGFK